MDHIDWEEAAPDLADKMDVRARWVSTPDKIKARREKRDAMAKEQQMVDAAPAMASVAATASKQGMLQ
jgi:hypothetical protein